MLATLEQACGSGSLSDLATNLVDTGDLAVPHLNIQRPARPRQRSE